MNSTLKAVGIILVVVILVAGFVWTTQMSGQYESAQGVSKESDMNMADTVPSAAVAGGTASGSAVPQAAQSDSDNEKSYTSADVALHKDASSCWSVIDGYVYDLTTWISKHPGGMQAILGLCGVDGSAKFHGKHGDNAQQTNALAAMKIGVLLK